jgi:SHS2 domain-containing protein
VNPYGQSTEIETTADLGMEVWADTLDNLFSACAWQLFQIMIDDVTVRPKIALPFHIALKNSEPDLQDLFVTWLNELIFIYETEHILLCEFEIHISEWNVDGTIRGETVNLSQHSFRSIVKAVTYHDLTIDRRGSQWYAHVILDV